MNIFFSRDIKSDIAVLDKVESNHCLNVLRNEIGDKVMLVDGEGCTYECIIDSVKNKIAYLNILNKIYSPKKNNHIHIAISPVKNHDRIEWFIEKSIEIGVDEISFISCERTLRRKIRIDRLKKIAVTAMKQSLKSVLPKINDINKFDSFIRTNNSENNFICFLDNNNNEKIFEKNILNKENICILIGPEGDFTKDEVALAIEYGFKPLSLGNSRLRTETAGIVACNLANIILGN